MADHANQVFADIVQAAGIEYVFGMPGGVTPFLFDALTDKAPGVTCVLSRHEGAASCMADMAARLTGKPAIVMGQGLWIGTNGAFGIVESALAGTPMVVITETSDYANLPQHMPYQCCTGEYGSVDLPAIMKAMCKFTTFATSPIEFLHGVQLAIKHAVSGRPGPAAVVCRWNAAVGALDLKNAMPRLHPVQGHLNVAPPAPDTAAVQSAAELLIGAKNPVLVAGIGIHLARAHDELRELAELLGMAVATSFMGKSAIPETHDLAVGMMGRIGQAAANKAVSGADVILAAGTGLAPDNTLMLSPDYIRPADQNIIQIDIEPRNIGFTFPVHTGIVSDARAALRALIQAVKSSGGKIDASARRAAVAELKQKNKFFECPLFTSAAAPIAPERVVAEVQAQLRPEDLVVLDAGNNRMFFAKYLRTLRAGQLVGAGGAAGIGWGVPAAVAAQIVRPDTRVICMVGDGGLMSTFSALETARQHNLPLTYVVLNNASLGNVNDFIAPGRRQITEYAHPNFAGMAAAMDFHTATVERPEDIRHALEAALGHNGPALVDIHVNRSPHFTLMS